MGKLQMLDPRADGTIPPYRGWTIWGKVVGILDNGQANSSPMFEELAQLIGEQTGAAEVLLRKKPSHMQGAPGELIEEMLSRCDAVITGLGA